MLNRYLAHMRNVGQQWFKFLNAGSNPYGRSYHTMASEGTRIFVIGGYSKAARVDETPLIHVFDRSMYFSLVVSSGRPPRLRTQRTSSIRNLSLTPSILMRKPLNVRGYHPLYRLLRKLSETSALHS